MPYFWIYIVYFMIYIFFFELPNASCYILWMPYCVVMTYLWMPIIVLYIFLNAYYVHTVIFLNAYYVFCDIYENPIVALYISMSTCCCLVHIYKWPVVVLYIFSRAYCVDMTFYLYGLLCAMTHISFKSHYSNQVIQVLLTQDKLVIK